MKALLCGVMVLSLSGCFYQSTTPLDFKVGEHFCKGKGGVSKINSYFDGIAYAVCVSGEDTIVERYYRDNYKEFTND